MSIVLTPHRAPHTSLISHPQSPADVQKEREASKLRLLDVWSSLAERYTRRLDEDDIVDIITGDITQDRGFIRNSRKVDFGAIAAPAAGDATVGEGTDEGTDDDEEDEYDRDELDAFADMNPEMGNAEQSKVGLRVELVPPVTAPDPFDAEDLRAFLEAEQRRKQICGSDVEEDDYSAPDTQSQYSEVEDESAADFEDLDPFLLNDTVDTSETCSQTALYVDSASEDELDNWDIDESSVVYPVFEQGGTLTQRVASVPSSPKYSSIEADLGNMPGPHLDLTQFLKVKRIVRNDSTLHSSPNKSISITNVRMPSIKPYVLLTPRKSTGLTKSKTRKQNSSGDEEQEPDTLRDSNPRKAVEKGKAKAKADETFEAIMTAKVTTEDGKVFATNKVKERHQPSSNESKSHSEGLLTAVPFQIEPPLRIDQIDRQRLSSISPSKPHSVNVSQHETLRENLGSPRPSLEGIMLNRPGNQSSTSRKRKRVSSNAGTVFAVGASVMQREETERHFTPRRISSDDLSYNENQASTFYMIPDRKRKSTRRSSSQNLRPTLKSTVSGSESDSGNSSDGERRYSHKLTRSHGNRFQSPPYHHYPQSYTPSPHRKQQRHPPPEMFVPPMPDPRAQFIITQAMEQLSALVGMPWPPHDTSSVPYTPSRRYQSRPATPNFGTPNYHPHPYPYSYDPKLSLATLPPESPESASSPEKLSHRPRKSSMIRGRSRGRRVSFKINDYESGDGNGDHDWADGYSSPSNIPSRREVRELGRQNSTKPSGREGKARMETPSPETSSKDASDCGNDIAGKSHLRGRTPGPKIGPPKGTKHGRDSKGRNRPESGDLD